MLLMITNEAESASFAQRLAAYCQPPLLIYLQGEIGAGKTTLIRALLRTLGVEGPIKSPTFSLIEPYQINHWHFYHIDLYRLSSPEELEYVGLSDCLTQDAICCIEWPERADKFLPAADLTLKLTTMNEGRQLQITAGTTKGAKIVEAL